MAELPKDAEELFDVRVPKALEAAPERARAVDAIYCFKITGDGGGEWTVDLASDPPSAVRGEHGIPQCTIEVAAEDFQHMMSNPQVGMELSFQGKLKVSGEPLYASKLRDFFALVREHAGSDSE